MKQKIINLLTICRRAGRMELGFDPVKDKILCGEAKCILCTGDISEKTLKEVHFCADRRDVPVYQLENMSMTDIADSLGRRAAVIAVCDKGFASKIESMLTP
ncbi:MAG: 50S ribosomal protein L7 [Ruminococcus sp.]|nr:50S ribosomal protein L7 [Ruminococcus sp.]